MNPRTRIRLGRALRHGAGLLRGSLTNVLLGIVVVLLLVLIAIGVASPNASRQTTALLPLLQAQAINAVSLALLAVVAWLGSGCGSARRSADTSLAIACRPTCTRPAHQRIASCRTSSSN